MWSKLTFLFFLFLFVRLPAFLPSLSKSFKGLIFKTLLGLGRTPGFSSLFVCLTSYFTYRDYHLLFTLIFSFYF